MSGEGGVKQLLNLDGNYAKPESGLRPVKTEKSSVTFTTDLPADGKPAKALEQPETDPIEAPADKGEQEEYKVVTTESSLKKPDQDNWGKLPLSQVVKPGQDEWDNLPLSQVIKPAKEKPGANPLAVSLTDVNQASRTNPPKPQAPTQVVKAPPRSETPTPKNAQPQPPPAQALAPRKEQPQPAAQASTPRKEQTQSPTQASTPKKEQSQPPPAQALAPPPPVQPPGQPSGDLSKLVEVNGKMLQAILGLAMRLDTIELAIKDISIFRADIDGMNSSEGQGV